MSTFRDRIMAAMIPYARLGLVEGDFTTGALISAVLRITTAEDALAFYEGYVDYLSRLPQPPTSPASVAQSNIGWCFGEGMKRDGVAMWVKVCGAAHPVFGTLVLSAEEAIEMGKKLAKAQ